MAINDIITVGATPVSVHAYWAAGGSEWFADAERARDLVNGWRAACDRSGVAWGGGETPALAGVVAPGRIDLAASCVGIVRPKSRLTLGERLAEGDAIVLLASSGIHANGVSLARKLVERLADGYRTPLADRHALWRGAARADAAVFAGDRGAGRGRHRAALLRERDRPRLAQADAPSRRFHVSNPVGAAGAAGAASSSDSKPASPIRKPTAR